MMTIQPDDSLSNDDDLLQEWSAYLDNPEASQHFRPFLEHCYQHPSAPHWIDDRSASQLTYPSTLPPILRILHLAQTLIVWIFIR
jgi:hypothetical protein